MTGSRAARWRRVDRVLAAALEVPAGDREGLLARECGDDDELRQRVERLLAADQRAQSFLETPAGRVAQLAPQWQPEEPRLRNLGAYRLLRRLGAGGMGTVFLATRADDQYEGIVAIKILRQGIEGEEIERRFLNERQILASLVHPGIARLYDGGYSEDCRPYFVMEYVEGLPIDLYCDQQKLTVRERVELFLLLCAAVQHAHQNLLVHRDIKPSNVLVTEEGCPKLLDFGIAKVLPAGPLSPAASITRTGHRALTPGYASPEQTTGCAIATTSDVYSLGVLLYELLTGVSPYRLESGLAQELEQAICEQMPEKPSTRVKGALRAKGGRTGEADGAPSRDARESTRLSRRLRGDLDNIVLKALRKEPGERYGSVQQLAEDLRRHLDGRPVLARPQTLWYRVGRFIGRNRLAVGAGAAIVVLSIAAAISMALLLVRISSERDRTRTELERAESVATFLVDIFGVADPSESNISARELLERGAESIAGQLNIEQSLKATLLVAIGSAYRQLGLYDKAEGPLQEALAIRLEALPTGHADIGNSLFELAMLEFERGNYQPAEDLQRQALAIRRALPEDEQTGLPATLASMGRLVSLRGELEAAEAFYREALAINRRTLDPDHPEIGSSLTGLGDLLEEMGRSSEAVEHYREALAIFERNPGQKELERARVMRKLAHLLEHAHRLGGKPQLHEADRLLRQSLEISRRILGDRHWKVAGTLLVLGRVESLRGNPAAAEALLREAVEIRRQQLGDGHPRYVEALTNLAWFYEEQGRLESAVAAYRESTQVMRQGFPEGSPLTAYPLLGLGNLLRRQGKLDEAEPLLREVLELRRRFLPPDSLLIAKARTALGSCLLEAGELEEAEEQLRASYELLAARSGEGAELRRETLELLSRVRQVG